MIGMCGKVSCTGISKMSDCMKRERERERAEKNRGEVGTANV